jgi:nitroreductase
MPPFDLAETDRLLSTTRAVRRRLDLERPVEREVLLECIRLSQQAPTPGNAQSWRWVIVTDAGLRRSLAEIYRKAAIPYLAQRSTQTGVAQARRVYDSASWLTHNLERVPVHVIPCVSGWAGPGSSAGFGDISVLGGIFPAVWSFQLALRSRGLGSTLTTLHLPNAAAAAELFGIPDGVTQVALLPVAYTVGTDFSPAERPPAETIVHWERWG